MSSVKKLFKMDRDTVKVLFIWLFLSGFFAIFYYQTVLYLSVETLPNWFEKIVHGNADSPYNYRLLVPSLFLAIDRVSPLSVNTNSFIATFIIFLFSVAFLMRAFDFKLSDKSSVNSLLFASFFILLTFPMGGVQPWSYIDIGLYALAYMASKNAWKTRYYVLIISFALLNRETGVLLSIVPLAVAFIDKRYVFNISLYKKEVLILIYGVLFLFLIRLYQGDATHVITTNEVFLRNFSPTIFTINLFVYFGAFFWLFIGQVGSLNNVEKAFILTLAINIILILMFGLLREIRMFVPYVFLYGLMYSRNVSSNSD